MARFEDEKEPSRMQGPHDTESSARLRSIIFVNRSRVGELAAADSNWIQFPFHNRKRTPFHLAVNATQVFTNNSEKQSVQAKRPEYEDNNRGKARWPGFR
jgi:hypothetical protein